MINDELEHEKKIPENTRVQLGAAAVFWLIW
jgi:hypothetical protein